METSFYHDDSLNQDKMKKPLKRPMTLDFDNSGKKQKTNVLSSPDMNMLKLASPELERMLITSNGMVTTTPTPTQFINPKYVTEEQEAYARGFVEALKELHAKENIHGPVDPQNVTFVNVTATDSTCNSSSMSVMAASSVAAPRYTTLTSLTTAPSLPVTVMPSQGQPSNGLHNGLSSISEGAMPATVVSQSNVQAALPPMDHRLMPVKQEEEPQTVPCLGNTPPVSPINMEDQERIKLERKRERNRLAARKCRTRKLERISRLEDRVDELKGQNTELSKTANNLREQVARLKQQIMEHVNGGCQLMISQNLL
jgi:transcription factor AP-1